MIKYKIIYLFFILSNFLIAQTNYFVNKDGTGNFSTIAEVNKANLNKGDIISFKSGQQFSDDILNCKSGVTYNTYGGLQKAIIGNKSGSLGQTIIVNQENVTIDNLIIYGNKESSEVIKCTENYLTITNCEIAGGDRAHFAKTIGINHIVVSKGTGHKYLGNKIHDLGIGIFLSQPYDVEIGFNEMYDFWYMTSYVNNGGYAIGGDIVSGLNDVWDAEYKYNIHHNNIYNFEMVAFATGPSRVIYEYNEIHSNLDERIYRGGVKHGSVGKIYDNYLYSDYDGKNGGIGLVFRYNFVHDLVRRGEPNYTYGQQTTELVEAKSFIVESTNNGFGRAVYLYAIAPWSLDPDMGEHYGDRPQESPDNVISGLGYGNYWIHNNIFENCSNALIGRAFNYRTPYRLDLGSYFINNTVINCGWLDYITNDNGLMVTEANSQSPHTVVNNIIDYPVDNARYTGRWKEQDIYLDYNIYINQTGVTYVLVDPGTRFTAYFECGENKKAVQGLNEKHLTVPNWIDKTSKYFTTNIGPKGVWIPDVRIKESGNAHNKGMEYDRIGDTYTVLGRKHELGKDPTGRSFAYDMLGNLRTTNDIGAVGTISGNSVILPPSPGSKPIIINQPSDVSLHLGEEAILSVVATCDDEVGYQWWKYPFVSENESKIEDNLKYSGAKINSLTIKNISAEDAATKYVCEVYNVKDKQNLWVNSDPVSIIIINGPSLNPSPNDGLKILLEAPYKNGKMNSSPSLTNSFPKEQPYSAEPWKLNDNSKITNIETNYIDWVLIELKTDLSETKYSKPAILIDEGKIINPDGSDFYFSNIISDYYYIIIKHRNHLGVMSTEKVQVNNNEPINYDFTDSQSKAYGTNAMADLGNGKFALFAGDGDANGVINNLDFGTVANNIPSKGYLQGDLDMNGIINVLDYSVINKNILKRAQLQ